ncbi:MFS transporter [Fulvimarina endophytica]|uniref:MFS transporter n=1 Tax=Fulvimarina endophytica TaxID=2293836 RepID=A0A371X9W6_9HYPH|nr:MFS transporter [Fulvimarina endophytica]RFC66025.1 MFS transporter [Fulvimarina endophytica]
MTAGTEGQPGNRPLKSPAIWGWMSFDFAAQPFFTVVITFVFGPYFVSELASDPATGQTAWSLAATLAGICVALGSPVLGSIADRAGPRKPWIAGLACVQIASLVAIWFVAEPGSPLFPVVVAIVLAQIAAEFSIVFNDAMLPRLVARDSIGRVSNTAWGLGYAGGIVFLVFALGFLAASPETGLTLFGLSPLFGLDPAAGEGARATGPLAALWYAVFVLPLFLLVPDRARRQTFRVAVKAGIGDLKATAREIRGRIELLKFFIARMIYQDGVNALLVLGGAFAAGMFGWSIIEIGLFGVILNLTAIPGCIFAGALATRLGSKRLVVISVAALALSTIGLVSTGPQGALFGLVPFAPAEGTGLFARPSEKIYILWGLLVGLAFGPVQASSRAWLAESVTPDEAGRYFGFYALVGRATSFLAPASVAALTALAATITDPVTAARIGMSAIVAFFLTGLLILAFTKGPPEAGRKAVSA